MFAQKTNQTRKKVSGANFYVADIGMIFVSMRLHQAHDIFNGGL
jgi:hypothetical protein